MAGKKNKKQKKKDKKPLSRIGTSLFPRAMFAAVPRSPEPPQLDSTSKEQTRPPSALSSALLDATFVGRVIGSPSPPSTLKMTGEGTSRATEIDPQRSMDNSMARSSMYDYDDSDDDDDDEDDDEDLDGYMTNKMTHQPPDYQDAPGYATVEEIQGLSGNKYGTISNRARLDTPTSSEDESLRETTTPIEPIKEEPVQAAMERSQPLQASARGTDEVPGGSSEGQFYKKMVQEEVDGEKSGKKKSKTKKKKREKEEPTPDKTEALYSQPIKQPLEGKLSLLSDSSSLTGVTSPTPDDFSDLISPPPPWKRKGPSPTASPELLPERSSKKSGKQKRKQKKESLVHEPIIEKVQQDSNQYAAPQPIQDNDSGLYSHIDRTKGTSQLFSDDYLQRTNSRLETELQLLKREREDVMDSLDQRTKQLVEERDQNSQLRQQAVHESKQQRTELNKTLGRVAEQEAQISDLTSLCHRLREDNRSLQDVNRRLKGDNQSLQEMASTNQKDDGVYLSQLKRQAEAVIQENEELKNVVHKLNIQLSRYQAKYDPPQKGDPPGLPARGGTPRWLTDTKYLSPLITAYETHLREKEKEIQGNVEDIEELRRSTEEVIRENQRLHRKLETMGGAGSPGHHAESWLNEIEEQARLVLEENQVVLEQMDIQQRRIHDLQKKHAQETIRLTKRLAMVESEKNGLEGDLSEMQMKYGALKDQHEKFIRDRERHMPIQEHLDAVAEYKRNVQEVKRKAENEAENILSRLTAVEAEKNNVALKMADCQAENSQQRGEIEALQRAQKRLQHKIAMVQKELDHSQVREKAANQHLNKVLEIAEQTAAERDSFKKMARTQAQEKERAVNKLMAGNIAIGRMEEKLKMYKLRAESRVEDLLGRLRDQDTLHSSRLDQYDREMRHLGHLVKEKQDALDTVASDKRQVEEQLETVWQTATADNKRLNAKLAKSLRSSATDSNLLPFGSDSDNKGLLSSDSD